MVQIVEWFQMQEGNSTRAQNQKALGGEPWGKEHVERWTKWNINK